MIDNDKTTLQYDLQTSQVLYDIAEINSTIFSLEQLLQSVSSPNKTDVPVETRFFKKFRFIHGEKLANGSLVFSIEEGRLRLRIQMENTPNLLDNIKELQECLEKALEHCKHRSCMAW